MSIRLYNDDQPTKNTAPKKQGLIRLYSNTQQKQDTTTNIKNLLGNAGINIDLSKDPNALSNYVTPQPTKKKNIFTKSADIFKENLQELKFQVSRTEPIRKKIGEIVHEVNPFGTQVAYAPESEANAEQLKVNYENSLFGKWNAKTNRLTDQMVSGVTGGIIKPPTEAPKNVSDKVVDAIGNIAGAVASINKIGEVFGAIAGGSKTAKGLLDTYPKVAKYAFPLLKNIVAFDVYGQLDPDTTDRFKKLGMDTLMSIPYTGLGFIKQAALSIPASFGLGFGLAKMNGASNEDAIIQGGILGVLDASGRMGGKGTHFVTGRVADRYLKAEAVNTITQFSSEKITVKSTPEAIKQAFNNAAYNTHPDRHPELQGDTTNFNSVAEAYSYLTGKSNKLAPLAPAKTKSGAVNNLKKQISTPEGQQNNELINQYNQATTDLKVYQEANKENVLSIPNVANIDVVKNDDGKWAFSYEILTPENGIFSDFSSNELSTTREGAIIAAKKALTDYASGELGNVTDETKTEFENIIKQVELTNLKQEVKTEIPTAPVISKELQPLTKEAKGKWVDTVDKGAIPNENPLQKFVDNNNQAIGALFENDTGGYYIQRKNGTYLYNPITQDRIFNTAEQAMKEFIGKETTQAVKEVKPGTQKEIMWKKEVDNIETLGDLVTYLEKKTKKYGSEKAYKNSEEYKITKDLLPKNFETPSYTQKEQIKKGRKQQQQESDTFIAERDRADKEYNEKYPTFEPGEFDLEKDLIVEKGDYIIDRDGSLLIITHSADDGSFRNAYFNTKEVNGEIPDWLGLQNQSRMATAAELKEVGLDPSLAKPNRFVGENEPTQKEKITGVIKAEPKEVKKEIKPKEEVKEKEVEKAVGKLIKPRVEVAGKEVKTGIIDEVIKNYRVALEDEYALSDKEYKREKRSGGIIYSGKTGNIKQRISDLNRQFANEFYKIYKERFGEYPIGFVLLDDSWVNWQNNPDYFIVDFGQAETGAYDYIYGSLDELLEAGNKLKNRGRSSEIIQSDIQYEVEGTRPTEKVASTEKSKPRVEAATKEINTEVTDFASLEKIKFEYKTQGKTAEEFSDEVSRNTTVFNLRNVLSTIDPEVNRLNELLTSKHIKLSADTKLGLRAEKTVQDWSGAARSVNNIDTKLFSETKRALIDFFKIGEAPTKPKPRFAKPKAEIKIGNKIIPAHEIAGKIIPKNPTLPILSEFMVKGGILTSTNLEMALRLKTELTNGMYRLVGKDAVKTDTDPADFPIMPEVKGDPVFKTSTEQLSQTLKSALLSTADKGSAKYELTGVLIRIENGKIIVVSTDGYRLYVKQLPGKIMGKGEFILTNTDKIQKVITALGGLVETTIGKDYIKFSGDNGEIVARRLEGDFPNFQPLMPALTTRYSFDKIEIVKGLKELKPYVKQIAYGASVNITYKDGKITLLVERKSEDHPQENIHKEIIINVPTPAKVDIKSGSMNDGVIVMPIRADIGGLNLNVDYLIDAFNALENDSVYLYTGENKEAPIFISNEKDLRSEKTTETEIKGTTSKGVSGKGQGNINLFAENTPVLMGNIDKISPIQIPEMVELVKELTGNAPTINKRLRTKLGVFWGRGQGEIQLRPDIFKDPIQVAKTLAHEIGHLVDWLPRFEGKTRRSLLQKLYILKNHLKSEFGEEMVKNQDIREELWNLSLYWRPVGDTPLVGSFLQYRNSGNELYADAISVLFNSPGLLEQRAPIFYKAFFDSLEEKPDVNEKYWELQDQLFGAKEQLYDARENRIQRGFAKAEDIQKSFRDKKAKADTRLFERLRQQLDNRYYPDLKVAQRLEAQGKIFDDSANPKYLLQELSYANNDNYLLVEKLDREVSKPIKEAGMNDDDIGYYLLLNRIVTERKDIANPFGFDVNTAQDQLDYMKQRVGEANFKLLQDKVRLFHEEVFKSVEKAVEVGSYNKEMFKTTIEPNKEHYASFAVVDHLQEYIPASVKKQIGTLKEVANPYHITILKTAALNKLNSLQEAKNSMRDALYEAEPKEIEITKTIRTGRISIFKSVNPDRGQLELLEDGKLVSYDVDPYIAKSFKFDDPDNLNVGVKLLQRINQTFKSIVTTYNLGFAVAFNPIRDFKRNYKNIPNATIFNLLKAYAQSLPSAKKYARGQLDDITRQMVAEKMINAPIYDYNFDPREDGMGNILAKYGVIGKMTPEKELPKVMVVARKFLLKPVIKVLEAIRFTANTFESISKIAAMKVRIAGGETGKALSYNVRNFSGTPNWKVKGTQTETTNEIFIFSNIMKEGLKADFLIATDPKTRSGWWWKTIKVDYMPKLLMFLAAAGLFGSKLKDMFDKMNEYDKTNYITIPLGERNGKAVYLRIPHDETARLTSAIFWKMLNFMKERNLNSLQDVLAIGAGQMPNMTPVITILQGWGQYLTGKNPYDAFRGRTLIDDTTFQAGGTAGLKKMVQWTANTFGLSQFTTYDPSRNDTVETAVQILPGINRILKISDYGLTEKSKEVQSKEDAIRAREILKEKEVISKYVNQNKVAYKEGDVDIYDIGDQVVREVLGHDPETDEEFTRDKSMRTRLQRSMIIGSYDARFDSVIYATSNRSKISLLKQYQEEMTPEAFGEFMGTLSDEGIISNDVYDAIQP